VNSVWHHRSEIAQELCGNHFAALGMQFDEDKLAGSINSNKYIELALSSLNFSNIDMEVTDCIALNFFFKGLSPSTSGSLAIP
jgi:hypothetical protein